MARSNKPAPWLAFAAIATQTQTPPQMFGGRRAKRAEQRDSIVELLAALRSFKAVDGALESCSRHG